MLHRSHRLLLGAGSLALVLGACSASAVAPSYTYAPPATAAGPAAAPSTPVASAVPTAAITASPTATPSAALTFTPGTKAAPRVMDMTADDQLNFTPGVVQAAVGETVTFRIHNRGKAVHEFMVGPMVDSFADKEGTPEVADIGPGSIGELTFTFSGNGPFAFACHAPGHFEHGMAGYIELVGPGAPAVGTKENPRLVHLDMTDALAFTPANVQVAAGESIRFVMTNSGTVVHEFQVGPADKVAADEVDGTIVVEKDELDAGSTHALDYTFDGAGPYAY
ncbi:MAG TPA: plastocyanin/azurin family copper-binding protein, partial [Candidatus Deferrimicrobium sp.]|nr:plastocyanin/azurin family copper-binding protein [Candidatus Deferrimicrobium sp.]